MGEQGGGLHRRHRACTAPAANGALPATAYGCGRARHPAKRAHALFQALAAGHATLDTLAAHVGLSPRSLRRFSQSQFGYGAKTLERILRLQRFLRQSRALPQHSLAMLAADAGYADQAHLSREARELAGMTASELRLEWGQ